MIKWYSPQFGQKETELVNEVLNSGYVTEGPKTKELEEKLSKIVNAKHIIMTTSCTSALYLAIEADKNIRRYREGKVIIPDLTFVATKNAVEMASLDLKIWDVDNITYQMSGSILLQDLPKILLVVNPLGRCFDRDLINSNQPFTIICDNAGCLGSNVSNGKVGCYSLQANKIISCGQGGFCATDDDEYAKEIRRLKDFGRIDKDENNSTGFNFKFNDILAAIVLGQLDLLENRKNKLRYQYAEYKDKLSKYGGFIPFDFLKGEVPLWVEFITENELYRDVLFEFLKLKGIECRKPWKPFIGLDNSKDYYERTIWLPNGPTLNRPQQDYVIKCILEFYDGS